MRKIARFFLETFPHLKCLMPQRRIIERSVYPYLFYLFSIIDTGIKMDYSRDAL